MRSRLKNSLARTGYALGITQAARHLGDFCEVTEGGWFPSFRRKQPGTFLVLIYHRVNDQARRFAIEAVSTTLFENQMRYLSQYFRVLPLDEVVNRLREGRDLPRRAVAITFDDGYEDNYVNAFPLLRKYRLPATIFLTTGCIGNGRKLWFDRVLHAFECTREATLQSPEAGGALNLETSDQRAQSAFRMLAALKRMSGSERNERVQRLYSELRVAEPVGNGNEMLHWSQVREMANHGISFGSHTVSHPILSKINLVDAKGELADSKALIESKTGSPANLFAYPNGKPADYSGEVVDLVRKVGYQAAVTTVVGANSPHSDFYCLRRISASGPALSDFALALTYHHLRG